MYETTFNAYPSSSSNSFYLQNHQASIVPINQSYYEPLLEVPEYDNEVEIATDDNFVEINSTNFSQFQSQSSIDEKPIERKINHVLLNNANSKSHASQIISKKQGSSKRKENLNFRYDYDSKSIFFTQLYEFLRKMLK